MAREGAGPAGEPLLQSNLRTLPRGRLGLARWPAGYRWCQHVGRNDRRRDLKSTRAQFEQCSGSPLGGKGDAMTPVSYTRAPTTVQECDEALFERWRDERNEQAREVLLERYL